MAWIERFTCDICGKQQASAEEDWWIATNECAPPLDSKSDSNTGQPTLKLNPWDNALAHSADSKHLCGAGCAHTYLDRWMAGFRAGTDGCTNAPAISNTLETAQGSGGPANLGSRSSADFGQQ